MNGKYRIKFLTDFTLRIENTCKVFMKDIIYNVEIKNNILIHENKSYEISDYILYNKFFDIVEEKIKLLCGKTLEYYDESDQYYDFIKGKVYEFSFSKEDKVIWEGKILPNFTKADMIEWDQWEIVESEPKMIQQSLFKEKISKKYRLTPGISKSWIDVEYNSRTFNKNETYDVELVENYDISPFFGMLYDGKFYPYLTLSSISACKIEEVMKILIKSNTDVILFNIKGKDYSKKQYFTFKKDEKYEIEFVENIKVKNMPGKKEESAISGFICDNKFFPYLTLKHTEDIFEIIKDNQKLKSLQLFLQDNVHKYIKFTQYNICIIKERIHLQNGNENICLVDEKFNIYDKNDNLLHKNVDFKKSFSIFVCLLLNFSLKTVNFQ